MRELPVEQVLEAPLGDDDVPEAEVAVHDDVRERLGRPLAQPGKAVLDRGMRLAHRVELRLEAHEHVAAAEEGEPVRRDRVDLRELLRELELEARWRRPDDPAADRLALHALHGERLAAAEEAEVGDRSRHLHPGLGCRAEHLELLLERQRLPVDDAAPRAPHEQPLPARVHRPRLLRGAAVEQAHRLDRQSEPLGELAGPGRAAH